MSLKDIRERYGVDFVRGSRVFCEGRIGTVSGASELHIRVKFDGRHISSPCDPLLVHPCIEMTTVDAVLTSQESLLAPK